ncbi:MAG: hypothetical protein QXD79_08255 [Candidatus Methanomethylicia archaeon]
MKKNKKVELPVIPTEEKEIEEEVLSMEEALAKISILLTREEKIRMLTELDDQEIRLISSLLGVADRYGLDFVKCFVNNFMLLRVSLRRKGRGEIVNLAQQIPELTEKIKTKLGKFGIVLK